MGVVEDCCNFSVFSNGFIYERCKAASKLKLSFPSLTILSSRFLYTRCHKSDYGCFFGGEENHYSFVVEINFTGNKIWSFI